MDKSKKGTQIVKLSLLAALLFITPLLSSSTRPTYIYFIINLLIIILGFEAGFLSFSSKPNLEDKKNTSSLLTPQPNTRKENNEKAVEDKECILEKKLEKSVSEKIVVGRALKMNDKKMKKSPSMPSLFFIGGGGERNDGLEKFNEEDEFEEEEVEDDDIVCEQDPLFAKAEVFIGNFYKQLKMQREDSWKRLHDIYYKTF